MMAYSHPNPLGSHPPDRPISRYGPYMGDPHDFVVRLMPSTGLDGAFRVHLSPDSLERLGLESGKNLCAISSDSSSGYGIAWRALDRMGNNPKLRPAKMTDTLRAAFGFKEGEQVEITKTKKQVVHATKVVLTDVTPTEYNNPPNIEDDKWRGRARYLLGECEAFASGATFDVTAKKRIKKRFYVDHVESAHGAGPALYFLNDNTTLIFSDGLQTGTTVSKHALDDMTDGDMLPHLLDTSKIGGLVAQVQELNRHLDSVLNNSRRAARTQQPLLSRHVLIHGYEGTGKTLLLDRVRNTSPCKVFEVDFIDGSAAKFQAHVQAVFKEAIANAPSVVLIDELEQKVPKDQENSIRTLIRELDKIDVANVVVVAATRSLANVNSMLLVKPSRFRNQIELPIPDTAARKAILDVFLHDLPDCEALATVVSQKTHGFTGGDLEGLVADADGHAARREDHDDWVDVHARISMLNGTIAGQIDGSVHSQATTEVELATQQLANAVAAEDDGAIIPTMEDFAYALDHCRPTALREVFLETPKVRWSDIGGSETFKQRFDEAIGLPLDRADLFSKYHMKPSKGVLLYGPPGCSKTMTAQAVATMYDFNFISVKGAELISMYVGESERAVREVFRKAKQAAPCVIFFDEIDAIGSDRDAGGTKGLNVLTTLLTEMDGFETMRNVLVLAATNKPEALDKALLRPGRFDEHIYVGLPTTEARRQILEISLRDVPQQITDINRFVVATEGYSGAEIVRVCSVAKMGGIKRKIQDPRDAGVNSSDFEEALEQVKWGITKEMLDAYGVFEARQK